MDVFGSLHLHLPFWPFPGSLHLLVITRKKKYHVRNDPAESWLAYTVSYGGGKKLTFMNATWVVPSNPAQGGPSAPGWWFGIEPEPAANLIQPILSWGDEASDSFSIFNGYYQWDDSEWYQSESGVVNPGNHIYASVRYMPANNSYEMYIACKETGFSVTTNIEVEKSKTYTDAYFVVEHQPQSCDQYPANGQIVFYDINIALDNQSVTPDWQAFEFQPACDCTSYVNNSTSVMFTWLTTGTSHPVSV